MNEPKFIIFLAIDNYVSLMKKKEPTANLGGSLQYQ